MYNRVLPPSEVEGVPAYLDGEMNRLESELRNHGMDSVIFSKHHVEPNKATEGQVKLFDAAVFGTEGLYIFLSGAWALIP